MKQWANDFTVHACLPNTSEPKWDHYTSEASDAKSEVMPLNDIQPEPEPIKINTERVRDVISTYWGGVKLFEPQRTRFSFI